MSIASELTALQGDITSARSAIVAKGGTVTDGGGSSQLATDIATIPASSGDLDGIIDGSITEFVMPAGKTQIKLYRFYNFTALTRADLTGCTTVGNYAFDGCKNITGLVLPASLTNVGSYAFRDVSTASGTTAFEFSSSGPCTVGAYAFQRAKISKLAGAFGSIGANALQTCSSLAEVNISASTGIGDYAFQSCSNLTKFHIKVNGAIGMNAFWGVKKASDVNFDKTSVITSLGSSTFQDFGTDRSSASYSNMITLDFRNSTFLTIPANCFYSSSSNSSIKYMNIYFPNTVTRIEGYAFRYLSYCFLYFASATPPTNVSSASFSGLNGCKIFVPYNSIVAYKNATNWTTLASYINGYAEENTFTQGQTLPTTTSEGRSCAWYSGVDLSASQLVTTVDDASKIYYCKLT